MRRLKQSGFLVILLVLFGAVLIWSAIRPKDYLLWVLEVTPAIIGAGLCIGFYRKQPFTKMTYTWCFLAACIMAVGAHYSYSEVPLFDHIQNTFNLERNNYDKLGHFVQGILPVLISQEVLIRNRIVRGPQWINFLSVCIALSVAAIYELIEWSAILFSSETTENFLGMQGYAWDAQSDMLYALAGALITLLFAKNLRRAIENSSMQIVPSSQESGEESSRNASTALPGSK